jgi:hypothetical protein
MVRFSVGEIILMERQTFPSSRSRFLLVEMHPAIVSASDLRRIAFVGCFCTECKFFRKSIAGGLTDPKAVGCIIRPVESAPFSRFE